jgi:hypothetical protein
MKVSDRDWYGIRAAARRMDWPEVARRADALGWGILAKHARRAAHQNDSVFTIVYALRLDEPDDTSDLAEVWHA